MRTQQKLNIYFKAFSKKDWKRFGLFLETPFFNTSTAAIQLYHLYHEIYTQKTIEKITKEQIFGFVYSNESFKDGQLRTLFWRMGKLVETYLSVSELMSDEVEMEDQLIMALGRRNDWFRFFDKRIQNKARAYQEHHLDFTSLLQSVKVHHHLYFHEEFTKYKSGQLEIQRLTKDLNRFILLSKLKYHCESLFRKQIFKEESLTTSDPILEQIKMLGLRSEEPIIQLYARLVKTKETGDFAFYEKTRDYYKQNKNYFSIQEQQNLLFYLINFIIELNREGKQELYLELWDLTQLGLSSAILILNNQITYETFTNVVVLGCTIKKFPETYKFILDYQKLLDPIKAKLAVNLAWAYWHFHQADYEKVLDWTHEIDLLNIQPENPFRLRGLKLRAFYELYQKDKSYRELLDGYLKSFLKYLHKNRKLSSQQSIAYSNFVKIVQLLFKYQNKGNLDKKNKLKIHSKIITTHPLVLKTWLLRKINL